VCIVVKTRQDAIDKTRARARGVISEFLILATGLQGSHASFKVLEFFLSEFKAMKVLENKAGTSEHLNLML